jgi:hypothetical protein
MDKIVRCYGIFSGVMGGYHFIRGCQVSHRKPLRSNEWTKADILIADRFTNGLANGALYALPIWNIYGLFRLINRIEIHCRGFEKDKYPEEYEEVGGYNLSTL